MNLEAMTENQKILYRANERVLEQERNVQCGLVAANHRRREFEEFTQRLDREQTLLAELKREMEILEVATGEKLLESDAA